jgi:hypothetical protein
MSKSDHSKNNNWVLIFISGIVLFSVSATCRQDISKALEATWSIILDAIQDKEEAYLEPTTPPGGIPDIPDMGGNTAGNLKPICFLNTGTIAATVMPWTYVPLNTDSATIPSNASTVASPGGNTSACLSLSMGTYTWCYHWELGDLNDDGMIEYAHAIDNRVVILDSSDTDDMDLAEEVVLSVPLEMNEFPGVCQLGDQIIRWGNESVEWKVDLLGGIVIGGSVQGTNYYTWTIHGGTFDGVNLYFQATTEDAEGCKGLMEAWWTVTSTSVSSARILNGCGTESLEVHVFERTE